MTYKKWQVAINECTVKWLAVTWFKQLCCNMPETLVREELCNLERCSDEVAQKNISGIDRE